MAAPFVGVLASLAGRARDDGAFVARPGADPCPEATAWAILALTAAGAEPERVARARAWLARCQGADGRVTFAADAPTAYWVTPLAALAWHGAPTERGNEGDAVRFLLGAEGRRSPHAPGNPVGHDTWIVGWAWNEGTHSMVEPTALGLLAVRMAGQASHERAREAERLLRDRQLPHGGWNYGNTLVFGTELSPQPHATGLALLALAGHAVRPEVERSLAYLGRETPRLRAPLSLACALLGLTAYGERPTAANDWLVESAAQEARRGGYDTPLLALLTLAALGDDGVARLLAF